MRTSGWRAGGRGVAYAVVLACVTFGVASSATAKGAAAVPVARVDINRAPVAELKTLPGIGDEEARKIVAGRPWLTKADLVTKGVIGEGKYLAIRNRIVAANPGGPVRTKGRPR